MQNNTSTTKPQVSIVLPTYNGEKYLASSIDSVLAQTFEDWELIIVNDCSKDSTPQIAEDYAKRDSRIRVIHNEVNKKLPASLNVGFAEARGEFLTWTSDDNMYKPNALETLIGYLKSHPKTVAVFMNQDYIDDDGNLVDENGKRIESSEGKDPNKLWGFPRCIQVSAHHSNFGAAFMYRKSVADAIGTYDENLFCIEDYDYFLRLALAGRVDFRPENIYSYRLNTQSLTATRRDFITESMHRVSRMYLEKMFKAYDYTLHDRLYLRAHFQNKTIKECFPVLYHIQRWDRSLRKKVNALLPGKMLTDIFPKETR